MDVRGKNKQKKVGLEPQTWVGSQKFKTQFKKSEYLMQVCGPKGWWGGGKIIIPIPTILIVWKSQAQTCHSNV